MPNVLTKRSNGYIGVLSVIIISIITLSVAVSAALLSSNELLYSFGDYQSAQALLMADGCADNAAHRLKLNPAYSGGTIPYAGNSCTVVVSGAGSTRTVSSTVTVGDSTRTVQIGVSLLNNIAANAKGIDVTSWSE